MLAVALLLAACAAQTPSVYIDWNDVIATSRTTTTLQARMACAAPHAN